MRCQSRTALDYAVIAVLFPPQSSQVDISLSQCKLKLLLPIYSLGESEPTSQLFANSLAALLMTAYLASAALSAAGFAALMHLSSTFCFRLNLRSLFLFLRFRDVSSISAILFVGYLLNDAYNFSLGVVLHVAPIAALTHYKQGFSWRCVWCTVLFVIFVKRVLYAGSTRHR